MIDLKQLRQIIERAPSPESKAATVTRRWLEEVELELKTGAAALAELASIRSEREAQA